jgi:hypothetical protein
VAADAAESTTQQSGIKLIPGLRCASVCAYLPQYLHLHCRARWLSERSFRITGSMWAEWRRLRLAANWQAHSGATTLNQRQTFTLGAMETASRQITSGIRSWCSYRLHSGVQRSCREAARIRNRIEAILEEPSKGDGLVWSNERSVGQSVSSHRLREDPRRRKPRPGARGIAALSSRCAHQR